MVGELFFGAELVLELDSLERATSLSCVCLILQLTTILTDFNWERLVVYVFESMMNLIAMKKCKFE
jgi:hypothetical protein